MKKLLLILFVLLFVAFPASASAFIWGGQSASGKRWPFLGAIVDRKLPIPYEGFFCGSSLVHPRYVLTAAHCVNTVHAKRLQLVFGERNLLKRSARRVDVVDKRMHPVWIERGRRDLALLELELRLPRRIVQISENVPAAGSFAIAGWGRRESGPSPLLSTTAVERVSDEDCKKVYFGLFSRETMFCAGGRGRDACYGDSGGPIIQRAGGKPVLYGTVSFGRGCGYYPGIYARIDTDWVRAAIRGMRR